MDWITRRVPDAALAHLAINDQTVNRFIDSCAQIHLRGSSQIDRRGVGHRISTIAQRAERASGNCQIARADRARGGNQ